MDHLARFDEAKSRMQDFIEMPDAMVSSLVNFILQSNGVLSKKRRRREFEKMTDDEVASAEAVVRDVFDIEIHDESEAGMEDNEPESRGPRR